MRHVEVHGISIDVQVEPGQIRRTSSGREVRMRWAYGEIPGTQGLDEDPVDVLPGPDLASRWVCVVHQLDGDEHDEDKALVGWADPGEAWRAYRDQYSVEMCGGMTVLDVEDFKRKLATRRRRPGKVAFAKSDGVTNFPTQGDDKPVTLRSSQYEVFDPGFALDIKENHPDIWSLGGNVEGNDQFRRLYPMASEQRAPSADTEEKAVRKREAWAARHFDNNRIAGVVAQVKWLVVGQLGEDGMKALIADEKAARRAQADSFAPGQLHAPQPIDITKDTRMSRNSRIASVNAWRFSLAGVDGDAWDQVCKPGEFFKDGARSVFDETTMRQMVRNFASTPNPLPGDVEHAAINAPMHGREAPLAAKYDALALVIGGKCVDFAAVGDVPKPADCAKWNDGLWAHRGELTTYGRDLLTAKGYGYISPTFLTDGEDEQGKSIGYVLLTASWTVIPFLQGLDPITYHRLPSSGRESAQAMAVSWGPVQSRENARWSVAGANWRVSNALRSAYDGVNIHISVQQNGADPWEWKATWQLPRDASIPPRSGTASDESSAKRDAENAAEEMARAWASTVASYAPDSFRGGRPELQRMSSALEGAEMSTQVMASVRVGDWIKISDTHDWAEVVRITGSGSGRRYYIVVPGGDEMELNEATIPYVHVRRGWFSAANGREGVQMSTQQMALIRRDYLKPGNPVKSSDRVSGIQEGTIVRVDGDTVTVKSDSTGRQAEIDRKWLWYPGQEEMSTAPAQAMGAPSTVNAQQSALIGEVERFKAEVSALDFNIGGRIATDVSRGWQSSGFDGMSRALLDGALLIEGFKPSPGYHDADDVARARGLAQKARQLAERAAGVAMSAAPAQSMAKVGDSVLLKTRYAGEPGSTYRVRFPSRNGHEIDAHGYELQAMSAQAMASDADICGLPSCRHPRGSHFLGEGCEKCKCPEFIEGTWAEGRSMSAATMVPCPLCDGTGSEKGGVGGRAIRCRACNGERQVTAAQAERIRRDFNLGPAPTVHSAQAMSARDEVRDSYAGDLVTCPECNRSNVKVVGISPRLEAHDKPSGGLCPASSKYVTEFSATAFSAAIKMSARGDSVASIVHRNDGLPYFSSGRDFGTGEDVYGVHAVFPSQQKAQAAEAELRSAGVNIEREASPSTTGNGKWTVKAKWREKTARAASAASFAYPKGTAIGACPVCGKEINIDPQGKVERHMDPSPFGPSGPCPGTGRKVTMSAAERGKGDTTMKKMMAALGYADADKPTEDEVTKKMAEVCSSPEQLAKFVKMAMEPDEPVQMGDLVIKHEDEQEMRKMALDLLGETEAKGMSRAALFSAQTIAGLRNALGARRVDVVTYSKLEREVDTLRTEAHAAKTEKLQTEAAAFVDGAIAQGRQREDKRAQLVHAFTSAGKGALADGKPDGSKRAADAGKAEVEKWLDAPGTHLSSAGVMRQFTAAGSPMGGARTTSSASEVTAQGYSVRGKLADERARAYCVANKLDPGNGEHYRKALGHVVKTDPAAASDYFGTAQT